MHFKSTTQNVFFIISFLLAFLFLSSCSADNDRTQPTVNEQSAAAGADLAAGTSAVAIEDTSAAAIDAANQADVVSDRKNDAVIKSWEDYEASKMPLLAAIPEKNIYLYGLRSGEAEFEGEITDKVVLYAGDQKQEFGWNYMTPRFILPQLQTYDFDKDGEDELSVILYVGSGTGVSIEELHIVEIDGKQLLSGNQADHPSSENFVDRVFDDYASQLHEMVSFKTFTRAGELIGRITIGQKNYDVSLKDYQSAEFGKINNTLVMESIVRFRSENGKLAAEFGAGITSDAFASAVYIGTLQADVNYTGGKFKLKNLRFEENPK